MKDSFWRSWLALRLGVVACCALLLLLAGRTTKPLKDAGRESDAFAEQTFREWCLAHPQRANLQVIEVEVHFSATPRNFARIDGALITPIVIDLPGAQHLLEIASHPAALRTLTVEGITCLAWEYAGRVNREIKFRGLALVERLPSMQVTLPANPTFATMPEGLSLIAFARAKDLEEHGLDECVDFANWAKRTAGAAPYPTQILNLVAGVSQRAEKDDGPDKLCTRLRGGSFTAHQAQVAVVMAARELGIPAFGFTAATRQKAHLVGTYVDDLGWITVDVDGPKDDGWTIGGPPLLTLAPIVGTFSASNHGFWSPLAQVYVNSEFGIYPVSSTKWRGDDNDSVTGTTEARARPFAEVCG